MPLLFSAFYLISSKSLLRSNSEPPPLLRGREVGAWRGWMPGGGLSPAGLSTSHPTPWEGSRAPLVGK